MSESKTTQDAEKILTMQEVIERVRESNDVTASIWINVFVQQALRMRSVK